jgi:hypothetical protein
MATATQTTQNGDDLFRQAICAWESALESGVKMREESTKWLHDYCSSDRLAQWQEKGQSLASETIAKAQENIDEAVRLINQQAEASVRLFHKAADARQGDVNTDARARLAEWWEMAMESIRLNSEAVLKANSHILATWCELARKVNGDAAESMVELARHFADQAEKTAQSAVANLKNMVKQAAGD